MLHRPMQVLDAKAVADALPYDQLIAALDEAFRDDIDVPLRAHHEVPVPKGTDGTLLLMPAWRRGESLGVKIATVFPDNATRSLPAVFASYLLMHGQTGEPVAVLDGSEITLRRTAAASALAASYLARDDAAHLLMVGTGQLAPHLVAAHAAARPIRRVSIWGRRREAAEALAGKIGAVASDVDVVGDLGDAVGRADIISCATLSSEPLIRGAWLVDGQHVDLVGAFRPDMREADTDAVCRAEVYVDTRAGALSEAGELTQAIDSGRFAADDVRGELADLAAGNVSGRRDDRQVTLFKSVGTALEDLAAAELALRSIRG